MLLVVSVACFSVFCLPSLCFLWSVLPVFLCFVCLRYASCGQCCLFFCVLFAFAMLLVVSVACFSVFCLPSLCFLSSVLPVFLCFVCPRYASCGQCCLFFSVLFAFAMLLVVSVACFSVFCLPSLCFLWSVLPVFLCFVCLRYASCGQCCLFFCVLFAFAMLLVVSVACFSVFCLPSLCFLWSVLPVFLCFVCLRYASCGQCCLFFCVLFALAMLLVVSVACFSVFCLPSLCFLWSVLPVFLCFICPRYASCGQCCLFFCVLFAFAMLLVVSVACFSVFYLPSLCFLWSVLPVFLCFVCLRYASCRQCCLFFCVLFAFDMLLVVSVACFSVFCLTSLCFLWSVLPVFLCFICLCYASCGQCCLFFCVLFALAMLLVVSVSCFFVFCLPSLCFLWSVLPVFLCFVCLRYASCGQCCLFFCVLFAFAMLLVVSVACFSVFCLPWLCFLRSVLPDFCVLLGFAMLLVVRVACFSVFVCLRYASCGQGCLFFCVLFAFAMLLVVSVACFSVFCLPSLCFLWSVLPVFLCFICLRYASCQCCLFFVCFVCLRYASCGQCCLFFCVLFAFAMLLVVSVACFLYFVYLGYAS